MGVLKVAVTGAGGRFGAVLLRVLLGAGHSVIAIDRKPPAGEPVPAVTAVIDDLSQTATLRGHFAGCDALVHLAAIPHPRADPPERVFANNATSSYNVMLAAVDAGITKMCMASSVNAIGGAFSRKARYDYFPVDEAHPTYGEDAYSLSKWVLEAQADSIARLHGDLTIASLRFHGLVKRTERTNAALPEVPEPMRQAVPNHLWGYVDIDSAAQAVLLALQADFKGHETFFIVSPRTIFHPDISTRSLVESRYPDVPLRVAPTGNSALYSCEKAYRLLGWVHQDT